LSTFEISHEAPPNFACVNAHNNNARGAAAAQAPTTASLRCSLSLLLNYPTQMQSPPAARFYVRLSDDLAALLGRGVGDGLEVYEDELLDTLREKGLITYPSPLLGKLVEDLPEVFEKEVLPRLDPTGRALLARVGRGVSAAVVSSGLPRAGSSEEAPFRVKDFVGGLLSFWLGPRRTGYRGTRQLVHTAMGGHLEVLRWAQENGAPEWSDGDETVSLEEEEEEEEEGEEEEEDLA